jgi:AcrR family transcriptional regulator
MAAGPRPKYKGEMARAARTYHHGNLRRALLDAALALVAERGSAGFTMRELAREANVTHNAPYRHFEDKDALLAALAEEGFSILRERSLASPPPADPRAWLGSLGASYVAFAVDHPHHFRLMFGAPMTEARARFPDLARAADASFALLRDAIEACRAQKLLRRDLSGRDLTMCAWALVHGLASLLVSGQIEGASAGPAPHIRAMGAVFFEGALAPEAREVTPRRSRTGSAKG